MSENNSEVALLKRRIESLEAELTHFRGVEPDTASGSIFEVIAKNQPILQSFLKHTTYGVLIKDQDLRLRFINHPAQKLLGLSEEALLMQTAGGIFDPELARQLEHDDRWVLEHRQYLEREYDLVAQGKSHRMRAHKSPIIDTDDTVAGLFITMVPVTKNGEAVSDTVPAEHAQLIPVCSSCKSIRDAKGMWVSFERFLAKRWKVETTHTICPDCAKALYPNIKLKSLV